jgi:hypothetical protein
MRIRAPSWLLKNLARFGMDDIKQTTEALERVELHLFGRGQRASPRLPGKLGHEGMVMIGKLEFEKRPGGTGRKASLKFNHSLPGCYTGIGYRCIGSHADDCRTMRTLKEDLFVCAKGPLPARPGQAGRGRRRDGSPAARMLPSWTPKKVRFFGIERRQPFRLGGADEALVGRDENKAITSGAQLVGNCQSGLEGNGVRGVDRMCHDKWKCGCREPIGNRHFPHGATMRDIRIKGEQKLQ